MKSNVKVVLHIFCTEVMSLLAKGAVETVPLPYSESGFYSCYFLVPKKDGSLRPILDLRHLNKALVKRAFKMLTLKQILALVLPGDWFFSVDLKDAYFQRLFSSFQSGGPILSPIGQHDSSVLHTGLILRSRPLYRLARSLLLWSQLNLRSLRETHAN